MKTILSSSGASVYTIRVGADECRIRGYEIEPIEAIFAEPQSAARQDANDAPRGAAVWEDIMGPDELVAERMVTPPVIRKRARLVASRAILLGSSPSR